MLVELHVPFRIYKFFQYTENSWEMKKFIRIWIRIKAVHEPEHVRVRSCSISILCGREQPYMAYTHSMNIISFFPTMIELIDEKNSL